MPEARKHPRIKCEIPVRLVQAHAVHELRSADVSKHRVDKSEPVYDASGKPRADFFTE